VSEAIKSPRDTRRFSTGWCIGAAVFHFAATIALAGISFVVGMGAFTTNTYEAQHIHGTITFWRGVQWLWTPLAMAVWDPRKSIDSGSLAGLALIWSSVIGIIVGLFIPIFGRWLHKPLYPSSTLNDNARNA
jgi:hypothetical protein